MLDYYTRHSKEKGIFIVASNCLNEIFQTVAKHLALAASIATLSVPLIPVVTYVPSEFLLLAGASTAGYNRSGIFFL